MLQRSRLEWYARAKFDLYLSAGSIHGRPIVLVARRQAQAVKYAGLVQRKLLRRRPERPTDLDEVDRQEHAYRSPELISYPLYPVHRLVAERASPMNFDPHAAIDPQVVIDAKGFMATLPAIPTGDVRRIYLHWAVAPFGCVFDDYNAMVDLENDRWVLKITRNPQNNIPGLNQDPMAEHTWHRNSWALGIAIGGMDGATTHNFGQDPVQLHELQYLCAGAAALALKYDVQADDDLGGGEHTIMTHAEAALQDAYFGERWDLAMFEPGLLTPDGARYHGNLLRSRIRTIKVALTN
jgi:hypothetical protein